MSRLVADGTSRVSEGGGVVGQNGKEDCRDHVEGTMARSCLHPGKVVNCDGREVSWGSLREKG